MPPKKTSGNAGIKKRISGKRKEREMSSDDEFDFEQENNKKPGRPNLKSGLQPVTVPDDVKEKIVRLCPISPSLSLSRTPLGLLGFYYYYFENFARYLMWGRRDFY